MLDGVQNAQGQGIGSWTLTRVDSTITIVLSTHLLFLERNTSFPRMRPISQRRDPLRYPLDEVLGTEANVRVLRTLVHDVDVPLTASEVAALCGMTRPGSVKALSRLVALGLLDSVGTARSQKYSARRDDRLVSVLATLFDAEDQHYADLIHALSSALDPVPEVERAWISSSPLRLGEPLDLTAVVDASAIPWAAEELRKRLEGVERHFNLTVEISLFTAVDVPKVEQEARFITGAAPSDEERPRRRPRTHAEADAESLRLSTAVAELVRTDPSLVKRALRHIDQVIRDPQGAGTAAADMLEWRSLLQTYSPERLRRLLTSESSRAYRLRQSSPLLAALTADERTRLTALLAEKSS